MNKQICKMILTAFVLAFLLPIQVLALSNDSFELDTQGKVTLNSDHAAREGISSLQFSLKIDSNSADTVKFQFDSNIEITATVLEFRYHEDTGILNVYIAGTEALFVNGDSLAIGKVVVLDASQNGTLATVSVVADSLYYVYGTELRQAEDLSVPQAVTINGGSGGSDGSDDSGGSGESGGSGSSGESDGSGGSDSSGESQMPPAGNNTQGSGGPSSGSQGTASSSQNTASGSQSSGSDTSNGQPQSSGSNGTSTSPLAENYIRLKQTLENARTFKEEDYTSESYGALRAAIAKAEEVLGDSNAVSSNIDEVLIELENAIGALVTKSAAVDDSQQSGEQETGETLGQIVGTGMGNDAEKSRLPILLLIVGILALVGCGAAVVVLKNKNKK